LAHKNVVLANIGTDEEASLLDAHTHRNIPLFSIDDLSSTTDLDKFQDDIDQVLVQDHLHSNEGAVDLSIQLRNDPDQQHHEESEQAMLQKGVLL